MNHEWLSTLSSYLTIKFLTWLDLQAFNVHVQLQIKSLSHCHFYKLQWLPFASNRIQTPYPTNNTLHNCPASLSSMCFFFFPSTGHPQLDPCFCPHLSWVTCFSLCFENLEPIFCQAHSLSSFMHQFKCGRSFPHNPKMVTQLTLITSTLSSYFPHRKYKHLKLQHGCLFASSLAHFV